MDKTNDWKEEASTKKSQRSFTVTSTVPVCSNFVAIADYYSVTFTDISLHTVHFLCKKLNERYQHEITFTVFIFCMLHKTKWLEYCCCSKHLSCIFNCNCPPFCRNLTLWRDLQLLLKTLQMPGQIFNQTLCVTECRQASFTAGWRGKLNRGFTFHWKSVLLLHSY